MVNTRQSKNRAAENNTTSEEEEHLMFVWCFINAFCYKLGCLSPEYVNQIRPMFPNWDIFEFGTDVERRAWDFFEKKGAIDFMRDKCNSMGFESFSGWFENEIMTHKLL
ncbi:hypothetical protein DFS34DRAFT_594403 [Phlyctochytrium arcticum]|nr:hypothetical protein DFS34DRAFT_595040 [Phlyctochytrium arcticum]KAI9095905.1 hypothetical protein DFS34DRAFT_594921 [Phlyctochytrium arcticum]KAI9096490.1 hypothetical protein DFS34DRAFT_594403 [Phlyctochytrium arcticum]